MSLETITIPKEEAAEKWREYLQAEKANQKAEVRHYLHEMRRAYYYLKKGHKVLDLFETLKTTGLNSDGDPKLAICPSDSKSCLFQKENPGKGTYMREANGRVGIWRLKDRDESIHAPDNTFPLWPKVETGSWLSRERVQAPAPLIPAKHIPKSENKNLYLLWEVEHWKPVPMRDPLLLRRISKNLFVIYAHWNTTKLERAILRGRL